jgi:hypothetical protein
MTERRPTHDEIESRAEQPPCPGASDINMFGDRQGVIDLDAEVAHCALHALMPE